MTRVATFAWLAVLLLATAVRGDERPATEDESLLGRHSIAFTAEGMAAYLATLRPDEAREKQTAAWIVQLGDASFATRQVATRALLELAEVPAAQLRVAAEDAANSEVAARAKMILQHPTTAAKLNAANERKELTAAALRMIADREFQSTAAASMATLLVELAPRFDAEGLAMLAGDAMSKTATAADAEMLDKAMKAESVAVRAVAIRGLAKSRGATELVELRTLSRDSNPRVALAAAHTLVEQADRGALAPLITLVTADDVAVRVRAVQILRAATKQTFGENPYREPRDQKAEIAKWQTWLAKQDATVRLQTPLRLQPLAENLDEGLVLHYTFDEDGKGRVIDRTRLARHGELKNAVEYVGRGRGKALKIEGEGQHGDTGGHVIIPFVDFAALREFTLALWVNEAGMSHPEGEAYVTFGTDRGSGIEDALGIAHFNSNLLFRVGGGNVALPYDAADLKRWVHYSMTFRDGKLVAYKDGKQVATCAARVAIVGKDAALGRHWWADGAGTSARFQGALDEVRVYDRALSAQQVEMLMEVTK